MITPNDSSLGLKLNSKGTTLKRSLETWGVNGSLLRQKNTSKISLLDELYPDSFKYRGFFIIAGVKQIPVKLGKEEPKDNGMRLTYGFLQRDDVKKDEVSGLGRIIYY